MTTKEQEILNYMGKLKINRAMAEELWLADHDLESNEEQDELDRKAKQVKVDAGAEREKKPRKPREIKVSDEKKEIFDCILTNIDRADGVDRENVQVLKENKLILVKIGAKSFEIDIREKRMPKNQ